MKKYKGFIIGVITGMLITSLPIFADSYTRAIEAIVNFTTVQVNGVNVASDNMLIDDKTYVWIRDVADMLGQEIIWDETTNTANIVPKGSIPKTAVTVNGLELTDKVIKVYLTNAPGYPKESMITDLIGRYVVNSKADTFGLEPRDSYVSEMEKLIEERMAIDNGTLLETMEYFGVTKQEYAELIADENIYDDVYKAAYDNMLADMSLDDSILRAKYDADPSAYESVTAKHILVDTLEEANKLYDELNKGADFDKLMAEHSTDPGSKSNPNGYTFFRGEMVPEFENAAFTQEIGKIGEPVKSDYGYHIILVTDKINSYELVRSNIFEEVFKEEFDKMVKQWITEADIVRDETVISSIK